MKLHFFIGYDSKEDIAYRVCKHSLLKHSSIDINITSLKLDELIAKNLYTRDVDPLNIIKCINYFLKFIF